MSKIIVALIIFISFLFFCRTAFADTNLVINEFLANQASEENEWVEFYNPDHLDLLEYWLDDDTDFNSDSGNSSRKQLTSSNLNTDDQNFPYVTLTSSIFNDTCDSSCDWVVLFASNGSIATQYQYTNEQIQQEGKTIGRSPDGTGEMTILASATKGSANSSAAPSPSPAPASTDPPSPTPASSPNPSTSPAKSPSPKAQTKPSGTNTSAKQAVLGSSTQSPQAIALNITDPNNSPSPSSQPVTAPTSKVAGFVLAAGAVTIALSLGLFLWYKWEIKGPPKVPQE